MSDFESVVVSTRDGIYALEIVPEFGGLVNRLTHRSPATGSTELVAGLGSRIELVNDAYFRGISLYPWVNRLDGDGYTHQGHNYKCEINESGTNTCLHGFLFSIRPEIVERSEHQHEAALTLVYRYAGENPGYPFAATISLRYQLDSKKGLSVTFSVLNRHHDTVPLGIGWHPYFTLGQTVDQLQLQLPPVKRVLVNERKLPVGELADFADFEVPALLGDRRFDTCLYIEETESEVVSSTLWSPQQGIGIELWQERNSYPFIQVFIPPDRLSLALEPMSCGINAFNTGDKLMQLAPGKVTSARCGVRFLGG